MPVMQPNNDPGPAGVGTPDGVRLTRDLYKLSLRYWSDGRFEDGLRVGIEAAKMSLSSPQTRTLTEELKSILRAIAHELRSKSSQIGLIDEADALVVELGRQNRVTGAEGTPAEPDGPSRSGYPEEDG